MILDNLHIYLRNFTAVSTKPAEQILKTVFDTTSREFGIRSVLSAQELAGSSIPDRQKIVQYLTALHSHFNSEASKVSVLVVKCEFFLAVSSVVGEIDMF